MTYAYIPYTKQYVNTSIKLVQLHQRKFNNLDNALTVLSERITFLENQSKGNHIKDSYMEMVRLISSEAQTKDISEKHNAALCDALEKVT